MNFLSATEGLTGELLVSAVLRFLILRSQEARETFRDLISRGSNLGPIRLQSEFSCRLEMFMKETQNPELQATGFGRIDLLMQTDNAIIGIENKLDAGFQSGQPEKYREELERLAKEQTGKRQYFLVILAPKDRKKEISDMIRTYQHSAHYIQLDWEILLEQMASACAKNADRISQTVIDQLNEYIFDNGRKLWPKELALTHLRGIFNSQGVHGDFIGKLKTILPQRSRGGSGQRWTGFTFNVADQSSADPEYAWFGFMRRDMLTNAKHETELVLVTEKSSGNMAPPSPPLRQVEMKSHWWKKPNHAWAVDYDDGEEWKNVDRWRSVLEFLI